MRKPLGPKYDDVLLRYIWFLNNKLKTHFMASQVRTKHNKTEIKMQIDMNMILKCVILLIRKN